MTKKESIMLFSGESFASESSIAKFSSQATTPSKICRSFDIVLVNCRNVSMDLLCKSVDLPDLLVTTSLLRLHHTTPSKASTVLHKVGPTVFLPLSSSQKPLCKSVDSPDQRDTTSPLHLHHITPSQASAVLHRFGFTTLSPELLSSAEVFGLRNIETYATESSLA
ncbi:hypothetical protein Bca52824_087201 [Brassica carinata]|uniref:Uncharacterized protein n=1 Tax=Brassica carinata TaxID=52824 RepID=A0A8X7PB81_BRACI|nr:hypothetical protein Bca52824_087201 [Brassica carinata]